MRNIRIIAALTAAAAAIVPFSAYGVNAADTPAVIAVTGEAEMPEWVPEAEIPEWVPTDYHSVLDFRNKYGATHIESGYLCVVYKEQVERTDDGEPKGVLRYMVQETEGVMEKLVHKSYFSENSDYGYEVVLYHVTEATGVFETALIDTAVNAAEPLLPEGLEHLAVSHYTFNIDEDYDIHETDIYSWLPDSAGEYREYKSKYSEVSIKDNYVVFCLTSSAGTMYNWELTGQEGIDNLKFAGDYCCNMETSVPVGGGAINRIVLYKGAKDGLASVEYLLVPGYGGLPYNPEDAIEKAAIDCVVYDGGASILKDGEMKITLVDAVTGELIPFTGSEEGWVGLATDISTYDKELGEYISTGPIYELFTNPSRIELGRIFNADSYYFGLLEYTVPAGYRSAARYSNGKSYPEDEIEVRRFDNGSADVVFKLKRVISGDVNNDGVFGIADLVTLQKYLVSGDSTKLTNWEEGDFCTNGRLDIYDLCLMRRKLFVRNYTEN